MLIKYTVDTKYTAHYRLFSLEINKPRIVIEYHASILHSCAYPISTFNPLGDAMKTFIKLPLFAGLFLATSLSLASAEVLKRVKPISNGGYLNVRSGPGPNYNDIGDVLSGQIVTVIGYDATQKWAIINWNGQAAYVSARFLTSASAPAPSPAPVINDGLGPHRVTGITANDPDGGLVVRVGPGKSYSRLLVLPQGTPINIVEISPNKKWSRAVFSDGGTGWMRNRYLVAQNPAPVPQPAPTSLGALPNVFTVIGVPAGDVLWIRDAPDSNASKVGSIAPNGAVAVLEAAAGNWVKVSYAGGNGYVSSRYLTAGGGTTIGSGMQTGLVCAGTEPFWQFNIAADGRTRFEDAGNGAAAVYSQLAAVTGSGATASYPFDFQTYNVVGRIDRQLCSDGMSDLSYPFSLQLDAAIGGQMQSVYGCCTLQ